MLKKLARKHDIELTVLGKFTDNGKFVIYHGDLLCAFLDMEFLHDGGPRFELEAEWKTPDERGLEEPELPPIEDHEKILLAMLSRENISSYNYIVRQFDHEVQGGSVIKPLVGVNEDVHSDAAVVRPLLTSWKGIAFSTGDNPDYGEIDTYHMVMNNYDEAIRRIIAIGGDLEQVPMNDNFGWPTPLPSEHNPDARYKAAQLVRAAKAVADGMRKYGAPCISGKDSMFMDGWIPTKDGKEKRISAPPIVQMSAAALIKDVRYCVTMDVKHPGDLVYILGITRDELGGSEYYRMLGHVGKNVPIVDVENNIKIYKAHSEAVKKLLIESSHGIYRGGLGVHLALVAIAGDLGLEIHLDKVPLEGIDRDDKVLYSQSAGRLIVTVNPKNRESFEKLVKEIPFACIGKVTKEKRLKIHGLNGEAIINLPLEELRKAYHEKFDGELNERS